MRGGLNEARKITSFRRSPGNLIMYARVLLFCQSAVGQNRCSPLLGVCLEFSLTFVPPPVLMLSYRQAGQALKDLAAYGVTRQQRKQWFGAKCSVVCSTLFPLPSFPSPPSPLSSPLAPLRSRPGPPLFTLLSLVSPLSLFLPSPSPCFPLLSLVFLLTLSLSLLSSPFFPLLSPPHSIIIQQEASPFERRFSRERRDKVDNLVVSKALRRRFNPGM